MRLPTLRGLIRRRMLVNFRADPEVVRELLPAPFRPKCHAGFAIVGVCLIRLEQIRPAGFPAFCGISSENAAHRIAVTWTDDHGQELEGVYIPRRDTGSRMNHFAGGRIFPGEHHFAHFTVRDDAQGIDFQMVSQDQQVRVELQGREADRLPLTSCFASHDEASRFFEGGSLGYSVTSRPGRFDGLRLRTSHWEVKPLDVSLARSSFLDDPARFPPGSIEFDHALLMRDIPHEWHGAEDLCCAPVPQASRTEGTRALAQSAVLTLGTRETNTFDR